VKIDSLPFRTGFPLGNKELQLVLTPNILSVTQKNDKPPFGLPLNVLEGMKSTRKVADDLLLTRGGYDNVEAEASYPGDRGEIISVSFT
jgi:hypothetical protein